MELGGNIPNAAIGMTYEYIESISLPPLRNEEILLILDTIQEAKKTQLKINKGLLSGFELDQAYNLIEIAKEEQDRLVASMIKLVLRSVYDYRASKDSIDDLLQAGIIGILEAIPKFDVKKGESFPTYARWWIDKYILEEINKRRNVIMIPSKKQTLLKKIRGIRSSFLVDQNDDPTIEDFIQLTGATREQILSALAYEKANKIVTYDEMSDLDDEEDGYSKGTILSSLKSIFSRAENFFDQENSTNDVEEEAIVNTLLGEIMQILPVILAPQELHAFTLYFIDYLNPASEKNHTYKTIGEEMGISSVMVKRHIDNALEKIRSYLDDS
jgi:RNA polymerase sigma factor (sigma-70 family)